MAVRSLGAGEDPDSETIGITVGPVNDAPDVRDETVTTDEDTPVTITLAGTDIDGDTLTITTTQPAHGTYTNGTYNTGGYNNDGTYNNGGYNNGGYINNGYNNGKHNNLFGFPQLFT